MQSRQSFADQSVEPPSSGRLRSTAPLSKDPGLLWWWPFDSVVGAGRWHRARVDKRPANDSGHFFCRTVADARWGGSRNRRRRRWFLWNAVGVWKTNFWVWDRRNFKHVPLSYESLDSSLDSLASFTNFASSIENIRPRVKNIKSWMQNRTIKNYASELYR